MVALLALTITTNSSQVKPVTLVILNKRLLLVALVANYLTQIPTTVQKKHNL